MAWLPCPDEPAGPWLIKGSSWPRSTARSPLGDPADALLCDTTPAALQLAVLAIEASSLRGMDAIHIAAAQVCEADVFVSADARQCAAAYAAGLTVVAL